MYNPYQAPGAYGRPQDFGSFAGAPGMAPPPGMTAPGTNPPPGAQQANAQQPGFPAGFPANFQPPANMPNINFSAPVIRLGTSGPPKSSTPQEGGRGDREERGGGRRAGLGSSMADSQRQDRRENMAPLVPPTRDEIIRTIFVGGITEGAGGDVGVERILRAAGNLRRWTRATDADDKPCKFGFAEFEDPESLHTAVEILQDVEVPVKRQVPKSTEASAEGEANGEKPGEEEEEEVEKSKLIIIADDNTKTYLQKWEDSQGGLDEAHTEMRLDQARSALEAVLNDLAHPSATTLKDDLSGIDRDGDIAMGEGANGDSAEVITIPISVEEELSDIPAEMRETVAKEIAAFRERSNRRDLERLKREEEIEAMERNRGAGRNRMSSPPASAPSGPGGANGVPLGPRDKAIPNAPAGPKAFGVQIPKDYQKGVAFVNGNGVSMDTEDDDTDASDEELERRRKNKRDAELEKQYLDQERKWLNRERSRTAAVEREKTRDSEEGDRLSTEKNSMAKRLKEWNDDSEVSRKTEEYYLDRSLWIRNRASFRNRETSWDEADRAAEAREKARQVQQQERATTLADDFLNRQSQEISQPQEESAPKGPGRFKLSLGAAAAAKAQDRANTTSANRTRRVAEAEGLLEDEEESSAGPRRTLIPIDPSTISSLPASSDLTDEERAQAARQLAAEIPNDQAGLWAWSVQWEFVDEQLITEQLRPFVEKKIVEYLGVLEEMLVEVVEGHLRKREAPATLVTELADALGEEEAETLVKKLWRMLIFFSESEKRGLSN